MSLDDPLADPSAEPVTSEPRPVPPRALRLNPRTRNFDLDATGLYPDQHPTDAEVVTAMLHEEGRIASAPTTGNSLRKIPSPYGPRVDADADTRTRFALRRLTTRGAISNVGVAHQAKPQGSRVRLTYINEELAEERAPDLG